MAIPLMDPISWKFTGKPWDLNSYPLTPDEVWGVLDLPPEEVRLALNALIGKLNSVVDGSSGGDNVGMTPIPSVDAIASNTQAIMEALVSRMQSVVDGSSGGDFIKLTAIAGLTGSSTQSVIESLKSYVDTDYALKSELNNLVLGEIPNDSLTTEKLAFDPAIQSEIFGSKVYAYKNIGGAL